MSLTARGPPLVRGFTTTVARAKKLGVPDKADKERLRQDQEKRNKERSMMAREARARGEDWAGDHGYQPVSTRVLVDRKRNPELFIYPPGKDFKAEKERGQLAREPPEALNRLKDFSTRNNSVGDAVVFPKSDTNTDPITAFGIPRTISNDFQLLGKRISVVRQSTIDVTAALDAIALPTNRQSSEKVVVAGSAGCGKSYTLLQAVWHAANTGWLVVYLPRTIELITNISDYLYDRRQQVFMQNKASLEIIKCILAGNPDIRKASLGGLVSRMEASLEEPDEPAELLWAVLKAMGQQNKMPVLFAVDELQALFSTSLYRDPLFNPIEACHLSIPRILLEFASGRQEFHKGMFLGAYSTSNTQFPVPLVLREAARIPHEKPEGPYSSRPEHHVTYAKLLKGWHIPGDMDCG
ncbi:mitochondrial ribosomal death-associated protein 3-domain-containing protein, partial [Auriculariales sp. MPI-PUGE-AT-0066]